MPANKNALIRYKTIDRCLSNRFRRWTLEDLVDECSMALREMEGMTKGVSVRTVQSDIQMMRSDKLGYNAPIEVYDLKYYRYSDPDYTITCNLGGGTLVCRCPAMMLTYCRRLWTCYSSCRTLTSSVKWLT